jgi:hypothetical protein
MAVSPRLLAVPASVLVVRAALLAFAPAMAAPGLLLALDVTALLVLALAAVFGRVIGAGFGSTVFTFVGVGLPVAGLGALTEAMAGRDASNLSGMLALLGVGVGFCLAGPAREDRFTQGLALLLGLGALALGSKLLVETHGLTTGAVVASPYLVAALLALALRPLVAPPPPPA